MTTVVGFTPVNVIEHMEKETKQLKREKSAIPISPAQHRTDRHGSSGQTRKRPGGPGSSADRLEAPLARIAGLRGCLCLRAGYRYEYRVSS
jgi:hypothetical protein